MFLKLNLFLVTFLLLIEDAVNLDFTPSTSERFSADSLRSCEIPNSEDRSYYDPLSRKYLTPNSKVKGNGTAVLIECHSKNHKMKITNVDHFSICFDGKWYHKDHSCIEACGVFPSPNLYRKLKIEDQEVIDISAPWNAEILEYNNNSEKLETFCGGTLISHRVVLTAFDCVSDGSGTKRPPEELNVGLGRYNKNREEFTRIFAVNQIYEGRRIGEVYFRQLYGLVLLKLNESVLMSHYIMPACFDSIGKYMKYIQPEGTITAMTSCKLDTSEIIEPPSCKNKGTRNIKRMVTFQLPILNFDVASRKEKDPVLEFYTKRLNFVQRNSQKYIGAGLTFEFAERHYIFGVHIDSNSTTSSKYVNVYADKIKEVIENYIKKV